MKKDYICPPNFVRNGNSCYYFSTHIATWQEAHFECKDKGSELARLEKGWEDRNMRSYLNRPELGKILITTAQNNYRINTLFAGYCP